MMLRRRRRRGAGVGTTLAFVSCWCWIDGLASETGVGVSFMFQVALIISAFTFAAATVVRDSRSGSSGVMFFALGF